MPITEPIDEDELEADLAAMEQEKLDDQMLSTGTTVPVADRIDRLPNAANGESESPLVCWIDEVYFADVVGVLQSRGRRKRRRWKRTTRRRS